MSRVENKEILAKAIEYFGNIKIKREIIIILIKKYHGLQATENRHWKL